MSLPFEKLRVICYCGRRDLVYKYLEKDKYGYNYLPLFHVSCDNRWIDLIFRCGRDYKGKDHDICKLFREPFEYKVVNVCVKMFDRNLFKSSKLKSNK
jgi:hypothetical protein